MTTKPVLAAAHTPSPSPLDGNASNTTAERADAMQSLRDVFAGMPELARFHDRLSEGPEFTEQELADARAVLAAPRKARQGRLL